MSVYKLLLLLAALTLYDCQDNNTKPRPVPSETFPRSAELDEQDKYHLFWSFDNENITFEVHVRTAGWVGFGLSKNGRMAGADMVVGWIKDGNTHFQDRHAHANSRPSRDKIQNYELLRAEENEDFTIFKFTRPLQTCDDQDYQLDDGTVRVIFAWSEMEPEDSESFLYHGATQRGVKSLRLLAPSSGNDLDLTGLLTLDLIQDQVALPTYRTYYHCRLVPAPTLEIKHHVIRFEPVIEVANRGSVHHIVIYQCMGETQVDTESSACDAMPDIDGLSCESVIFAWAVGGEAFDLPAEAGMSIGSEGDATYYLIETHYDNPEALSDIIDSSGIRVYYTAELRQHDSAVLILGNTVSYPPMVIPPGTPSLRLDAFCGSQCTQQEIPEDGINMFGSLLHTHVYGRAIQTRIFRDGQELPLLDRDDNYDFNYQSMKQLTPHRNLLPGDELMTSCVYNTSRTNTMVLAGAGTDDEMCLVFVMYYPRIQLQSCLSNVISPQVVYELVKKQAQEGKFGPDYMNPQLEETYGYLQYLQWDAYSRAYIQSQIDDVQQYDGSCVPHGKPAFGAESAEEAGVIIAETRMEIQTPLVEADPCPVEPEEPVDKPSPQPTEVYPHQAQLDEQETYFLYWKFDTEIITFEVHVRTTGWVGFGLSGNGRMAGADIVVGWIKDGTTSFKDRHATENSEPQVDGQQDYRLLNALERDGFTIFKFSRKLQTCDDQDYQIDEGTVRVIFAWNDMKPEGQNFFYHGANRGARSIVLLDHIVRSELSLDGLQSFDLLQSMVSIPEQRTYYHCTLIEPPPLNTKHHVIRFDPLIEEANRGIVHHILIYQCYGEMNKDVQSFTCFEMPDARQSCDVLTMAWAIGQQELPMPADAGMSIGASTDPTYYLIETHYDNPQLLRGVKDSSGIRMVYTSELRKHDVGILTLGNTVGWPPIVIPPHVDAFRLDSFCGTNCTQHQIPDEGINVFGYALHTHTHGTAAMTRLIRDGVELPPLAMDHHYDFNYQAARVLPEPVIIKPGDQLVTTCVYDTSNTESMVLGGPGTEDEMCLNFVYYYPRIQLQSCLSHLQSYEVIYNLVNKQTEGGAFGPGFTLEQERDEINKYLFSMPWNDEAKLHMQQLVDETREYDSFCVLEGEKTFGFQVEPTKDTKMTVTKPYKADNGCSGPSTETSGSRGFYDGHVTVMAAISVLLATCILQSQT